MIAEIINYISYSVTKNRSLIPLDLNIMLVPYKLDLQATADYHRYCMHCGHYTASVVCYGKTINYNDTKFTVFNVYNTHNLSTAYIPLYKCIMECLQPVNQTVKDGSQSTPIAPAHLFVQGMHVEEWAPKPVALTMCFLMIGLVQIITLIMSNWCWKEWPMVACPFRDRVVLYGMLALVSSLTCNRC